MSEKTQKLQPYKIEAVKKIKALVESSKDLIFTNYRGLNIKQMSELRNQLRAQKAEYRVIKNNFTKIALRELGYPFEEAFLVDPTALALVKKDVSPVVKILMAFVKDSPLKVKGAMIEGRVFGPIQVEAISRLPSREHLYAQIMGSLKAPISRLVYALNEVPTRVVRALKAMADAKAKAN